MTTPDEKALEAVKDAAQGWEGTSAPAIAEWAIRAYLDALPPAERRFMARDNSGFGITAYCTPPCDASFIVPVEIREVRS